MTENHRKLKTDGNSKEDGEIQSLVAQYELFDSRTVKSFSDMPLSLKTLKGLSKINVKVPTFIQRESIGHALRGKDILGSAVTGSGKTLAFLIPMLEILFVNKWSRIDGVGAIIISPTRELAYQTFECLKKIGAFHDFSAGLIIGGKNLKFERKRMDQCNIIVCTPGRLLQHMDENPLFNASSMFVLILDEADRCLDMGFEKTINCIIENLSKDRQTLLFSATQTKSVKELARLSLKNPISVAPSELQAITPTTLKHNFIFANLEEKISVLWSFLKSHLKQKIIVFLSSCKQVKYMYEIICKLRPGMSVLALYGTLHQDRRVSIYEEFKRKSHVVLFATDIASRGLDFPIVNWVIQLDCPEDVKQYIHRAGRSARNNLAGDSLLVLMPSEKDMLEKLKHQGIEIKEVHIDPKKQFSPHAKIEAFLAQNKELKESARRAFLSYIKSIYLMKDKSLFQINKINIPMFAKSLGLSFVPRVRFLERYKHQNTDKSHHDKEQVSEEKKSLWESIEKLRTKNRDDFVMKNMSDWSESDDDGDDLLTVKRRDHDTETNFNILEKGTQFLEIDKKRPITKAALAKRVLKKKIQANNKVEFDENGSIVSDHRRDMQSDLAKSYFQDDAPNGGFDLNEIKQALCEEDKFDKIRFGKIVKAKHRKIKNKMREKIRNEHSINAINVKDDVNDTLNCSSDDDVKSYIQKNELMEVNKGTTRKKRQGESNSGLSKKLQKTDENLSLEDTELLAIKLLSK